MMKRCLMLLILLLSPVLALGDIPPELVQRYAPLEGYVVDQVGDEFIVDLDAEDGLHVGDILTLEVPGRELVHPKSGEVIGYLEANNGFLVVQRIREGYAFATLLPGDGAPPEKGAKLRRFAQVPAKITAAENVLQGEALRQALPHVAWLGAEDAVTKPLLVFTVLPESVTAVNTLDSQERVFTLPGAVPVTPDHAESALVSAPVQKQDGDTQEQVAESGIVRKESADQESIWYGPSIEAAALGMTAGDFDGDGRIEMALASKGRIDIVRMVQRDYVLLTTLEVSAGRTVLAIDSLDDDADGVDEVVVSAFSRDEMKSFVLGFQEGEYRVVAKDLPWHLKVVSLPGEGEVLIGQQMDMYQTYHGPCFRMTKIAGTFVKGDPIELPRNAMIYSFAYLSDGSGDAKVVYLSETDYLKLSDAAGDIHWESSDYLGGSEIRFERFMPTDSDEPTTFFTRSRVHVGAGGEIVVPNNIGSRISTRYRNFDESQLVAMQWNGVTMTRLWETVAQDGYLADFALADIDNDGVEEVATYVKFVGKGLFNWSDRSNLVIYEMD